ncbi:CWF19 1 [Brachionus plicatilis]|uniref:CWF19 1 n=1 Tax=Brachionus plicatilis TaxID=10195 RepID=A0A3M7T2W5_BRAPC|nr:CWF19 1 [Brachionus plicatilis]
MSAAESDKPLKILVSGDVEGRLSDLYSRVKSIQSKVGKFDILFCVGEFFAQEASENAEIYEYISDPSLVPIQTYVLGPNHSSRYKYFFDKSGCDLCADKIIYLGPKGTYSTLNGLNIVYLSGFEKKNESVKKLKRSDDSDTEEFAEFELKDIESIINNYEKRNAGECIDILLTNQWPKNVENLSNQELENKQKSENFGSELVAYLAQKLKPRYHFSAVENFFFERIPYRNHQVLLEKEKHMTRFLGLAKVNKSNKPKFLYAFNIVPAKSLDYAELVRQTANPISSDNPYSTNLSLKNDDGSQYYGDHDLQPSKQYFYDADYIKKMNELQEQEMLKQKRKLEAMHKQEQEPCWFCLGGSKVERQYIVSVGDKCYLAYAKGALNKDHLLIIPIDHVQSTVVANEDLMEEIDKYKLALAKYFKSRNKCVLFYERNYRTKHMQIQVYAIRADKTYLLKDAFMSMAQNQDIYLDEIPQMTNLKQILEPNRPFFYLELPNEELHAGSRSEMDTTRYLCEIRGGFPINFGRDVMASEILLNCPDRIDWKTCVISIEEEKIMSQDFRKEFKMFDPAL